MVSHPHRRGIGATLVLCATACLALAIVASPLAAHSKLPPCAQGHRSTAAKPCRVVKKTTAVSRYVPTAICNPGEKSTAAKPCITLSDNGPPPSSSSSSSSSQFPIPVSSSPSPRSSSAAPTTTTHAAPLSGPHISTHLCQDLATGTIFECQPELDPGNPSLANYPALQ